MTRRLVTGGTLASSSRRHHCIFVVIEKRQCLVDNVADVLATGRAGPSAECRCGERGRRSAAVRSALKCCGLQMLVQRETVAFASLTWGQTGKNRRHGGWYYGKEDSAYPSGEEVMGEANSNEMWQRRTGGWGRILFGLVGF